MTSSRWPRRRARPDGQREQLPTADRIRLARKRKAAALKRKAWHQGRATTGSAGPRLAAGEDERHEP